MSPRAVRLVLILIFAAAAGCGGSGGGGGKGGGRSSGKEPTTAKEKQLLEAKAAGELDASGQPGWGKWRYTGDRAACYFVAGGKCFKAEAPACQAMKCKPDQKCKATGAGPATLSCVKK